LILVYGLLNRISMSGLSSSKNLTFIAVMAALGNVFSFISMRLAPLVPSIPLGPTSVSIALDFSHLTTFIAAMYGGPVLGGLTGLIGGLVAAFEFGFSQGNFITGFGLPAGKALTGIAAGVLMTPEGIFTYVIFMYLFPLFIPGSGFWVAALTTQVLLKAFVEMIVMGLLLTGITSNQGFTDYVKGSFA